MDQRRETSETGFWFFLLWFLACLLLFFWEIKPHPFQSFQYLALSFEYSRSTWFRVFQTWGNHVLFLISFVGAIIVFCGTGNRILKWVGSLRLDSLENWVWSLAVGFGFWGLFAEGLAFENLFFPPLLRGIALFSLGILVWADGKAVLKHCWPFNFKLEIPSLWLWPAVSVVLLSLSNLLVPEMSWDAITYQLVLPKFYFINHGFYPVVGIVPAHYPSLGQMIFSWGLIWDSDSLARSFSFMAHFGTALGLVAIGNRLSTLKVGWIAAFFYWVFPYLNIFSTRGYVDLFTGFYSVLGLGYLMVWLKEENEPALGVLGASALGLVWAIKYNAVSFWLAGLIIFLGSQKKLKFRFVVGSCLVVAPIFFCVPWALKSWAYTGNPFYPHLAGLFRTFDWTDFDAKASAIKFHVEGLGGLVQFPLLPWTAIFRNYGGAPNEELSLVPIILFPVLIVLLALKWRELRWKGTFLAAIGIPLFFWLVTTHQLRLISGTIALGCIPLAVSYDWMVSRWGKKGKVLEVLMAVLFWICAFYLFQGLAHQPTPFACALGFQTRDDFLSRVLRPEGYVSVANDLNQSLPPDAKVLIVGQQNGYYLDRISAYDFDYTYPELKKWSEKSSSPEELYKQFKENSFTHILYNANAMMGTVIRVHELGVDRYPWTPQELKNYEQFFLKYTRKIPLPVGNGYSLYEVGPREGFSNLPDFLPGTEWYYVKAIQEVMKLPQASGVIGKSIPAPVFLQSYQQVAELHPEIGLPCFQWAFGELGGSTSDAKRALQMGREGFRRNGDVATWDALQGDFYLAQGKSSKAAPFLVKAQSLSPEREDVARNLAVAYYNEHHLQKAIEEADQASALAPFSDEYRQLAIQLHSLVKP